MFNEIKAKPPAEQMALIEAWVTDGKMETEYLDFKNSGKDDPATWSRTLSSFGNTEGGLIVWGIDARAKKVLNSDDRAVDCACELKAVKDTRQHVQLLKDTLRDSTNEPIHGIEHLEVPANTPPAGYVISFVPEGKNKPYRALRMPGQPYYWRVGDSSQVISHNMLRSLFPLAKKRD